MVPSLSILKRILQVTESLKRDNIYAICVYIFNSKTYQIMTSYHISTGIKCEQVLTSLLVQLTSLYVIKY